MNKAGIDRLRRRLQKEKLDAFLVTKAVNITYLSGFQGEGQLLITPEEQFLITDFRYQEEAAKKVKSCQLCARESFAALEETVKQLVRRSKVKALGFEADHLSYDLYGRLSTDLSRIKLTPTKNIIEKIRAIKGPGEIKLIKKAAACALASFAFAHNFIKPGKSEEEVAQAIQYFMKKAGAEGSAFEIIVASGKRCSLPHAYASKKTIKKKEAVLVDLGCRKSGYNSDLTRMVFLGKMGRKIKRIYDIVIRAQQLAIQEVRAGAPIRTVDNIARQYITKEGFGSFFGHALGHGIGKEVHEYPAISPKSQEELVAGMVITIEPGIYIPGWGGVRIEDMVLVTKNGAEILTR